MKKLAELFGSSSRELKSVRTITVCAMLAAAAIILVNFRIELTNTQRIGFSGIPNQLVAYLFGPAVSCLFAGALDIIKYLIKPVGAFFPGLTLVTMLAGLIYGFFFYKKPLKLTRVLAAHFLVDVITLDVMMPEQSGLTFYGAVCRDEDWKRIPVVMLSAVPISGRAEQRSQMPCGC